MKVLLTVLFFICLTTTETMTGKVVKVTDGDTVVILTAGKKQERIRLLDIDAPERKQPYYDKASSYLSEMVFGKRVTVEYSKRDRYGRVLGTVYVDGKNVNEEMIRAGLAWNYHYSKNQKHAELETEAKEKKLNIFSVPNPINPYDYRRGQR